VALTKDAVRNVDSFGVVSGVTISDKLVVLETRLDLVVLYDLRLTRVDVEVFPAMFDALQLNRPDLTGDRILTLKMAWVLVFRRSELRLPTVMNVLRLPERSSTEGAGSLSAVQARTASVPSDTVRTAVKLTMTGARQTKSATGRSSNGRMGPGDRHTVPSISAA
jgi:hypothetical protein